MATDAGTDIVVDRVAPEPGLFTRLRAFLGLAVIVAVVGLAVALMIGAGATLVTRTLETAVQ